MSKPERSAATRGAQALRAWMKARGMTQEELAVLLKVKQTTVSKWLGSSRPEYPMALKIEKLTAITQAEWWAPVKERARSRAA